MGLAFVEEKELQTHVLLPPKNIRSVSEGVKSSLRKTLLKYDHQLGGIPMDLQQVQLLSSKGSIHEDQPVIKVPLKATYRVFVPKVGAKLEGVVNKITTDHVGLLVHGLFNASIARDRLKTKFSYSPESETWVSRSTDHPVAEGDTVRFQVERMEHSHGVLFLVGEPLDDPIKQAQTDAADKAKTPKKKKKDKRESSPKKDDHAGPDADTASKKRKRTSEGGSIKKKKKKKANKDSE